jgi:hypothetical protein
MTQEIVFPEIDLDEELFIRGNPVQATFVVFNCLASNDATRRDQILARLQPQQLRTTYDEFLFRVALAMIEAQGRVDVEGLSQAIRSYGFDEEFLMLELANLDFLLTFNPTPEQLDRALDILTSLPPGTRLWKHCDSGRSSNEAH